MAAQTCPDLRALQAHLRRAEDAERAAVAAAAASNHTATVATADGADYSTLRIQVGNTCQAAEREGYVNWTLFVHGDGEYAVADRIKRVTVTLHPSFRNNVVVLDQAPFRLTRCGWGTFEVGVAVEVYTTPGSGHARTATLHLTHELDFDLRGASRTVTLAVPGGARAPAPAPAPGRARAPVAAAAAAAAVPGAKGSLFEDLAADAGLDAAALAAAAPGTSKARAVVERAMHGTLGAASSTAAEWAAPVKVVHCDVEARPGYATRKAHEYNDTPAVLRAKVALLADMVCRSRQMAAYTGAGISTASGIGDYASKAKDTTSGKNQKKKKSGLAAEPTLAHRVLAAMHRAGFLKHWVQQNHDGLPQKAGFPQHAINEIHGAWQDPSNPVVPMDGHLRGDLIATLETWSSRADLCLVLGTSMCGMAADDFALEVNRRARKQRSGLGMVVVSLQQTQHDAKAALRIFAKIDEVMAMLAEELDKRARGSVAAGGSGGGGAAVAAAPARVKTCAHGRKLLEVRPYAPAKPLALPDASVFRVPYGASGDLAAGAGAGADASGAQQLMVLDLRPGAPVRVTRGVGKGFEGTVRGVTETGDFVVALPLQRENHPQRGKKKSVYTLGRWWVTGALAGEVAYLPVVNTRPKFVQNPAAAACGDGGGGGGGGGNDKDNDDASDGADNVDMD